MRLKPIFMASLIAGLTICALPVFAAGAADFGRQQDDHSRFDRDRYRFDDRDFDQWFQHRFIMLHDRLDDLVHRSKIRISISKDIWSDLKRVGDDEHRAFKRHEIDPNSAARLSDRLDDVARRIRRESREDWDDRDGRYDGGRSDRHRP